MAKQAADHHREAAEHHEKARTMPPSRMATANRRSIMHGADMAKSHVEHHENR
jgi:hypothetical protein